MKLLLITIGVVMFSFSMKAQLINIHKTDGNIVSIAIDNIDSIVFSKIQPYDEFYYAKPNDWNCVIFKDTFT